MIKYQCSADVDFHPYFLSAVQQSFPFSEREEDYLFYDIETTGLSPEREEIYMIGTAAFHAPGWVYSAYFSEGGEEESLLLQTFLDIRQHYPVCVQYNGNSFDRKFINKRLEMLKLSPVSASPELDLFRVFTPLKKLLSLSSMKQTELENLFHSKRQFPDGKECVHLYRAWKKKPDPIKEKMMIGHNQEDLKGLLMISRLGAYLQLYHGDYKCKNAILSEDELMILIEPFRGLPLPFEYTGEQVRIRAEENIVRVCIPVRNGKIRKYYPDYKNYDYVPSEDTAITKSLGRFLERRLKKPARPETCYTWFSLTESFLSDPLMQEKYLRQTLSLMLAL